MNNKIKFFVILIASIFFSYLFSSQIGVQYEKFIGHNISSGWIDSCGECWLGFILLLCFLFGLLIIGLLGKNRIKIGLPLVFIWPFLALIAGDGMAMISLLIFGMVGLFLGQIIYWLRHKIRTRKKKLEIKK